ncbi:phosphoribosylformylglycinamidine cyclo-ligase [Thermoclostridium stercorarium subsp. thermolacticum DSM 2910]|jgi:phosphoribosylformylglycinamidine cyclo-ligase|nr:phosphoribosylformylglycinamidine cyclo-ligase [Thermoclostridium stercorarium]AGI40067.1 phosphoribosylformylglycinamidine cyclo-ligase [Thermoclostridium stercorarium subsp. stercorarium DSM 8532]ANW99385.1 phosphoribosylformylglycinamidine cyclo-ligase [Thermoclostridium stercorarium subsp. thermolacticum DSM 2910]ANX02014.1 phosphoribosylformylglycinamidine cyclo-ligase [Thermoclostridium stercorarium subsp. leptospartum DSM 9219]UZQ85054.1 phosphoribosylformylglycinamidine cyclo-ligase 
MADYKDAGVDIHAGYRAVELMKKHIARTMRPEVLTDIGGFGGLFSLENINIKKPVLVSGTDGVGTKLKLAFALDRHDTVGIDCVAMCVNDVICSGARPLFFLDYIATGKLDPFKVETIVKGISDGCVAAGCALIGGETAEMPGFYPENEYDLAGFCVGIADKDEIIDGSTVKSGDKLIGIASSGVHSNGFSLVRKIFSEDRHELEKYFSELNSTLGDALLTPTKIYVKTVLSLVEKYRIKGIAHITGGGFIENIPRMIPGGLKAVIHKGTWPVLPVFKLISEMGNIGETDMFNTFNMGIGMVLAVDNDQAGEIISFIGELGEKAYLIGEITEGEGRIEIC